MQIMQYTSLTILPVLCRALFFLLSIVKRYLCAGFKKQTSLFLESKLLTLPFYFFLFTLRALTHTHVAHVLQQLFSK